MSNKTVIPGQDSGTVKWTATAAVTAGNIQLVNHLAGVVQLTGVTGDVIPIAVEGVHTLTKPTGVAWAVGEEVYSDGSALTKTDTANTFVGLAWEAATSGAGQTSLKVGLKGYSVNALTI